MDQNIYKIEIEFDLIPTGKYSLEDLAPDFFNYNQLSVSQRIDYLKKIIDYIATEFEIPKIHCTFANLDNESYRGSAINDCITLENRIIFDEKEQKDLFKDFNVVAHEIAHVYDHLNNITHSSNKYREIFKPEQMSFIEDTFPQKDYELIVSFNIFAYSQRENEVFAREHAIDFLYDIAETFQQYKEFDFDSSLIIDNYNKRENYFVNQWEKFANKEKINRIKEILNTLFDNSIDKMTSQKDLPDMVSTNGKMLFPFLIYYAFYNELLFDMNLFKKTYNFLLQNLNLTNFLGQEKNKLYCRIISFSCTNLISAIMDYSLLEKTKGEYGKQEIFDNLFKKTLISLNTSSGIIMLNKITNSSEVLLSSKQLLAVNIYLTDENRDKVFNKENKYYKIINGIRNNINVSKELEELDKNKALALKNDFISNILKKNKSTNNENDLDSLDDTLEK